MTEEPDQSGPNPPIIAKKLPHRHVKQIKRTPPRADTRNVARHGLMAQPIDKSMAKP